MEPLSIVASVLGILQATDRVLSALKGNVDRPPAFERLISELSRVQIAIPALQSRLDRVQTLNKDRASLIQMDVLVVLLTEGAMIMAELDDTIENWQRGLQLRRAISHAFKNIDTERRARRLIVRIDKFIESVLMVNIILDTPSDVVALETQMTFQQNIIDMLVENRTLTQKLHNLESSIFEKDSHRAGSFGNGPDLKSPQNPPLYHRGFEADLETSRVYQRAAGRRLSQDSTASSGLAPGKAGGWSQASGVDNISDIAFNGLSLEQAPVLQSQATLSGEKNKTADQDTLRSKLAPAQTKKRQSTRQLGYSASFFSVSIHSRSNGVLRIDGITLGDIDPGQLKAVAWLPPQVNDDTTPAYRDSGEEKEGNLDDKVEKDIDNARTPCLGCDGNPDPGHNLTCPEYKKSSDSVPPTGHTDLPEDFVGVFSGDLYKSSGLSRLSVGEFIGIHMHGLLRQCAQRLSHNASSKLHREAAYLIQKNQYVVFSYLRKWKNLSPPATATLDLPPDIKNSVAYQWLLGRVQTHLATIPGDTIPFGHKSKSLNIGMDDSSLKILREGLVPTQKHEVLLGLDLRKFYNEQQYDKDDESVLDRIITFSTAAGQTSALTSGEYMRLMWPTTAEHVLNLLKRTLRTDDRVWQEENLDFNSFLRLKASPGKIRVQVSGCDSVCEEIFEQLGWICAAFQSSKTGAGTSQVSRPDIITEHQYGTTHRISPLFFSRTKHDDEGSCWKDLFRNPAIVQGFPIPHRSSEVKGLEISLEVMALLIGTNRVTEFAGRLYIKGFSAMAVLTTQTTDIFVWHFVFNWDGSHISYTDERALEAVPSSERQIDMRRVESARNVLGWCPKATDYTGRPNAQYHIGYSGLPKPSPGCAFEKIQISAGYIITGGITAIPGKKDKAVHLTSRDDYISKLKWISTKFVLFYDVSTRRGWLVNGLSALVHILRASLQHDKTDGFEFLLKWDEIEEPPITRGAADSMPARDAAIFILSSEKNQKLRLWSKSDSAETEAEESSSTTPQVGSLKEGYKKVKEKDFFRLKDRVEQIYRVMEQMVAHQSHVEEQDGVGLRVRVSPRRRLEGFNFMDIATGEDPIWPQVTTISAWGLGWVDLVRSLNAITLFGRDFGDLMMPIADAASSTKMCPEWERLPKGRDYLAVSGSVLKDILKKGNTYSTPWRLVEDVWWHDPNFSQDCFLCTQETSHAAIGKGPVTHTDRVQVLLPGSSVHKMNLKLFKGKGKGTSSQPVSPLSNTAAIIFGHSLMLPLRWSDHGDPVKASGSLAQLTDVDGSSHLDSQESTAGASSITPSTENTTPLGGSEILRSESGNASRESNIGIGQYSEEDVEQSEKPSRTPNRNGIKLIRGWFKRRQVVK